MNELCICLVCLRLIWAANCKLFAAVEEETMNTRAKHTVFVITVAAALCCANAAAATANIVRCGVGHAQTMPVRSSTHFTAVLIMHSRDDFGKNTHLCLAEYTLQITRPDGSLMEPFTFGDSDGQWGRPLLFRIDGFSRGGNRAFVFISEGAYPQSIETLEYEMNSGKEVNDTFLDRKFTKGLSRECAANLRIIGTSRSGRVVLGPDAKDKCSNRKFWELSPNNIDSPTGARVLPEYPKCLSSSADIESLETGTRVSSKAGLTER